MSKGVNKAIILGNLGQDPEVRYTANGTACCNISVATDESYKDKTSGQVVPKTEWHRVSAFGKLAEIMGQYLRKGSKVYIEGKLETRKWQDQSGQDRYTTEIKAFEMQMLDSKGAGGEQQPQPSAPPQNQSQGAEREPPTSDEFDSDIPF